MMAVLCAAQTQDQKINKKAQKKTFFVFVFWRFWMMMRETLLAFLLVAETYFGAVSFMRGVTHTHLPCSCIIFQPIIFVGTPSDNFEGRKSFLLVSSLERERKQASKS